MAWCEFEHHFSLGMLNCGPLGSSSWGLVETLAIARILDPGTVAKLSAAVKRPDAVRRVHAFSSHFFAMLAG